MVIARSGITASAGGAEQKGGIWAGGPRERPTVADHAAGRGARILRRQFLHPFDDRRALRIATVGMRLN